MARFVNIGAYVDEGSMVDVWVSVGSCAQIGRGVRLGVGVCIRGVPEPMQAQLTIVKENSVIATGVHIGSSTNIFDRATREVSYGRIPPGSVIILGTLSSPADSTVRRENSSSRGSTRKPAPRPASINCCALEHQLWR